MITFLDTPLTRFSFTPNELFDQFFTNDEALPSEAERREVFDGVAELTAGFFKHVGSPEPQELDHLLAILVDYMAIHGTSNPLLFIASGLLASIHFQAMEERLRQI